MSQVPPIPPIPDPTATPTSGAFMSRRAVGALLAGVAGAALVVAASVPWLSGPDAADVVRGIEIDGDGVGVIGSRAGWSGGDGLVFVLAGLVALIVSAMSFMRRTRRWHRPAMVLVAVVAAAWTWLDVSELGSIPRLDGSSIDVGAGPGPVVALLGVALAVAAAVVIVRDHHYEATRNGVLAGRLERFGSRRDMLEVSQATLRTASARVDHDAFLLHDLLGNLCIDQAVVGADGPARANTKLLIDLLEQRWADDPEMLFEMRLRAAEILVTTDVGHARAYLDWLWSDAQPRFDPADPRLAWIGQRCNEVNSMINEAVGAHTPG